MSFPTIRVVFRSLLLAAALAAGMSAHASDKLALVIGNGGYKFETPVPTAIADADDVARRLGEAGFRVLISRDLAGPALAKAFERFLEEADKSTLALFYFSGHSLDQHLLPVDASIESKNALLGSGLPLSVVLARMGAWSAAKDGRAHVVILDASRTTKFQSLDINLHGASRALAPGFPLSTLNVVRLHAIVIASDVEHSEEAGQRNSSLTRAILSRFPERGVDISLAFKPIRFDVLRATGGKVLVQEASRLLLPVYLAGE